MNESPKQRDAIAYFVSFCIELYKNANGMSGNDISRLFTKTGLTDFLVNNFQPIHSQSPQWILEEINEYLSTQK